MLYAQSAPTNMHATVSKARWQWMLVGCLMVSSTACEKRGGGDSNVDVPLGAASSVPELVQKESEELRVHNYRLEEENRALQARIGSQNRDHSLEAQGLRKRVDELQATLKSNEDAYQRHIDQQKQAIAKLASGLRLGTIRTGAGDLTGVVITDVESDGVKVSHDGGITRVSFLQLPSELQFLFGRLGASEAKVSGGRGNYDELASQPGGGQVASTAPGSALFEKESLLIITTDKGTGSGFIAKVDGKHYAYTNAHVLCGSPGGFNSKLVRVTTANGTVLPMPYLVQISDTYNAAAPHGLEDLARFEVVPPKGVRAYELVSSGADSLAPTTEVVAYGNSLGGGVFTELTGTCLGVGPDRVEISCEIVPGNSGGPVVDRASRKVVGISTYLDASGMRDVWAKSTKFGAVRRFAVRPERVVKWRTMELSALYGGIEEFRAFDRDTLTLAAACFLRPRNNRGGFEAPSDQRGDYIVREVVIDGSRHRLGGVISAGIARVNDRLGGAGATISASAANPVYGEFFSSVSSGSASQVTSLKTSDRSPYMKQFVTELVEVREFWQVQFQKSAERFARSVK